MWSTFFYLFIHNKFERKLILSETYRFIFFNSTHKKKKITKINKMKLFKIVDWFLIDPLLIWSWMLFAWLADPNWTIVNVASANIACEFVEELCLLIKLLDNFLVFDLGL